MENLKGKKAIITGGSRGLGKATAIAFANQGIDVAITGRNEADLKKTVAELKALGVNVRITIKDSYMKLPFGPFVRAMGGIGINRRPKIEGEQRLSMVELMTNLFKEHAELVMLVTPEGTRAKQEKWKTGFYHVAVNAGVPIALAYMDYEKKKTGVGKIVYPTGDYEKDMAEIMQFYAQISPKFPKDFSVDQRYYVKESVTQEQK